MRFYYRRLGAVRRVLDVGCGLGCIGRLRPDPEVEVYGLDFDPSMIEQARRFEWVQPWDLNEGSLPFPDGMFDGVIARDILEHLWQPWRIVLEIRRVLRPGGRCLASVPLPYGWAVWDDYTHVRAFTRRAFFELFTDAGLCVESLWRMGAVPLSARLGLMECVPWILCVPGIARAWGRSWEMVARRPLEGQRGGTNAPA